jgi:hypothetical protein
MTTPPPPAGFRGRLVITAEMAEDWLDDHANSRPLNPARLAAIAIDMLNPAVGAFAHVVAAERARGFFRQEDEPIRFEHGVLVDGQHRLTAIVATGRPVELLVEHQ